MTLVPAYGRDYGSRKAVLADWLGDRDFVIADVVHKDRGRYVTRHELPVGTMVCIRYKRLTRIVTLRVTHEEGGHQEQEENTL